MLDPKSIHESLVLVKYRLNTIELYKDYLGLEFDHDNIKAHGCHTWP